MSAKYAGVGSKKFERGARWAVGSALLKFVRKRGSNSGSSGGGMDQDRANQIAERGMTGEELMELLADVSTEAYKEAMSAANSLQWSILAEAERVAVASDSLALYQFIQAHKNREKS